MLVKCAVTGKLVHLDDLHAHLTTFNSPKKGPAPGEGRASWTPGPKPPVASYHVKRSSWTPGAQIVQPTGLHIDEKKGYRLMRGHQHQVLCVAFSSSSAYLASASWDMTIRIWSMKTGRCISVLEGHTASVRSCVFSPDEKNLLSASGDKKVILWSMESGDSVRILEGHSEAVLWASFSHDGTVAGSASADYTVKLWGVHKGKCYRTLKGHQAQVNSCAFSPDGKVVASASHDSTIRLWGVYDGVCRKIIKGHSRSVLSIKYSSFLGEGNAPYLASCGTDSTIRIWNHSGESVRVISSAHKGSALSVAFSFVGEEEEEYAKVHGNSNAQDLQIASSGEDNLIRIWSMQTGKCVRVLKGHIAPVMAAVFAKNGKFVASCSRDRSVRLWAHTSVIGLKSESSRSKVRQAKTCSFSASAAAGSPPPSSSPSDSKTANDVDSRPCSPQSAPADPHQYARRIKGEEDVATQETGNENDGGNGDRDGEVNDAEDREDSQRNAPRGKLSGLHDSGSSQAYGEAEKGHGEEQVSVPRIVVRNEDSPAASSNQSDKQEERRSAEDMWGPGEEETTIEKEGGGDKEGQQQSQQNTRKDDDDHDASASSLELPWASESKDGAARLDEQSEGTKVATHLNHVKEEEAADRAPALCPSVAAQSKMEEVKQSPDEEQERKEEKERSSEQIGDDVDDDKEEIAPGADPAHLDAEAKDLKAEFDQAMGEDMAASTEDDDDDEEDKNLDKLKVPEMHDQCCKVNLCSVM